MSLAEIFNTLPVSPVASGIIGLIVAVVVLYLARGPAHKALYSLSRGIQEGFRLMADAVLRGAESIAGGGCDQTGSERLPLLTPVHGRPCYTN
jgi:hypothetical protein